MTDDIISETRMRAALQSRGRAPSHDTTAPRGRHRYVQDGEVPVVMINQRHGHPEDNRAKVAELEQALAVERQARTDAERALHQALEKVSQLQMRLAHAEDLREAAAVVVAAPEPAPEPQPNPAPSPAPAAADEPVEWWRPGWREKLRAR